MRAVFTLTVALLLGAISPYTSAQPEAPTAHPAETEGGGALPAQSEAPTAYPAETEGGTAPPAPQAPQQAAAPPQAEAPTAAPEAIVGDAQPLAIAQAEAPTAAPEAVVGDSQPPAIAQAEGSQGKGGLNTQTNSLHAASQPPTAPSAEPAPPTQPAPSAQPILPAGGPPVDYQTQLILTVVNNNFLALNAKIDGNFVALNTKIDIINTSLNKRIDDTNENLGKRIDSVEGLVKLVLTVTVAVFGIGVAIFFGAIGFYFQNRNPRKDE